MCNKIGLKCIYKTFLFAMHTFTAYHMPFWKLVDPHPHSLESRADSSKLMADLWVYLLFLAIFVLFSVLGREVISGQGFYTVNSLQTGLVETEFPNRQVFVRLSGTADTPKFEDHFMTENTYSNAPLKSIDPIALVASVAIY